MRVGKSIYFDHQATTPVDPRVLEKMQPFLSDAFGNPHSSEHFLGWQASKATEAARAHIAKLVNADADEIVFSSGATESNNLVLLGCIKNYKGKKKRVLVSAIEYKCVLVLARVLREQYGFTVERIPVDQQGVVDLEWLEINLDSDVLLVSVMAVNNEIGTIQPIDKISDLVKSVGALLHCDMAQAVCAMELDVTNVKVDFLSLSAHKIYGPKGVGALFVRRDIQGSLEPVIYGGGQENNLRGGTVPTHLCVGMGAAAELYKGPSSLKERSQLKLLRDLFVQKVCDIHASFKLNGPSLSNRHPGNANICFDGFVAQDLLMALQPKLAASTGSACTSGIVEPSYVLSEIGLSPMAARASVRFSLGRFTSVEDVEDAYALVRDALESLREI